MGCISTPSRPPWGWSQSGCYRSCGEWTPPFAEQRGSHQAENVLQSPRMELKRAWHRGCCGAVRPRAHWQLSLGRRDKHQFQRSHCSHWFLPPQFWLWYSPEKCNHPGAWNQLVWTGMHVFQLATSPRVVKEEIFESTILGLFHFLDPFLNQGKELIPSWLRLGDRMLSRGIKKSLGNKCSFAFAEPRLCDTSGTRRTIRSVATNHKCSSKDTLSSEDAIIEKLQQSRSVHFANCFHLLPKGRCLLWLKPLAGNPQAFQNLILSRHPKCQPSLQLISEKHYVQTWCSWATGPQLFACRSCWNTSTFGGFHSHRGTPSHHPF